MNSIYRKYFFGNDQARPCLFEPHIVQRVAIPLLPQNSLVTLNF